MGNYCNGKNDEIFDGDYIALIAILSVALQVYNLQQGDQQGKDNFYLMRASDKIEEKIEKIEGKLKTIERLLERSAYNGR